MDLPSDALLCVNRENTERGIRGTGLAHRAGARGALRGDLREGGGVRPPPHGRRRRHVVRTEGAAEARDAQRIGRRLRWQVPAHDRARPLPLGPYLHRLLLWAVSTARTTAAKPGTKSVAAYRPTSASRSSHIPAARTRPSSSRSSAAAATRRTATSRSGARTMPARAASAAQGHHHQRTPRCCATPSRRTDEDPLGLYFRTASGSMFASSDEGER